MSNKILKYSREKLRTVQIKIIHRLNTWLMSKSWKAAIAAAKKITLANDTKVWIVLLNGEFCAITKQEFKALWKANPKMKVKSMEQWQKKVYEFKRDSEQGDTGGIEYARSCVPTR